MSKNSPTQDFFQSAEEANKTARSSNFNTQQTAREQPSTQAPGRTGYGRPDLEQWTTEELKAHASKLNIHLDDREALIDALTQ